MNLVKSNDFSRHLVLIRFHELIVGFTGFYRVLLGCTRLNSAGMGFDWVSRALHSFLLGFTGFFIDETRLSWVFKGFYWVLLGLLGFNYVVSSSS